MAPLITNRAMPLLPGPGEKAHVYVRDSGTGASNSGAGAQSASDPVQGAADTPAVSSTVYLGIGVGVGGAILIAIIVVGVQILRKRAQHRRAVAELGDSSEPVAVPREQEIGEVPRPVSVARCGTIGPLHARAGWGALSSDETIHQPGLVAQKDKRKRNSISLPKKFRQRGIPLRRLKHLSAIIESPRSKTAKSPSPAVAEQVRTSTKSTGAGSSKKKTVSLVQKSEDDEDVFTAPGSPKPHVLPSFAIRSPGMYGAAIANDDRPRPERSVSVSALLVPIPDNAVFGHAGRMSRPNMHSRSISLGAPQGRPPSGPVPPLPVIAPHATETGEKNRRGLCVSRMSSSSQESASSSVLVTSPFLKMHEDNQPISSPSVEEVIADDDSAQLKSVKNRQWQNPLITGPRPMDVPRLDHTTTEATSAGASISRHNASIRSNIARYSTNSHRDSVASAVSSLDDYTNTDRLSIPQLGTADRVSISRVPSLNSLRGASPSGTHTSTAGAVQKITTPRKPSRQSSVSANGSPAERRKTNVLRDISGNAQMLTPSRQTSQSTQGSGRSSNGNPFQWDQSLPLMKHSALKGSPNSKGSKGHKRQNCVRISTLTPQILGPQPSRPTSPPLMQGIEEEEHEGIEGHAHGTGFVRHRLSRPASASRIPTWRVSLTPSSPTLSTWTAYQGQQERSDAAGLPSQHSDSQLSVSPITTNGRSASRQSDRSSAFTIPSFPSPSRAPVATVQLDYHRPIPEFSLSRPSTDEPEEQQSSSLFALHDSSSGEEDDDVEVPGATLPSSPPLPVSKTTEYDPAWPMLAVPALEGAGGVEYDPASPLWPQDETVAATEHSSPAFFPFAIGGAHVDDMNSDIENISPRSRPISYGGDLPDTPPCSPKTRPQGFKKFFEEPTQEPIIRARSARTTAAEKLTSANASALMATIPESPPNVGFPCAVPILSPPAQEGLPNTTPKARRQRAASNVLHMNPLRSAPPAPTSAPRSSDPVDVPSPLHIKSDHQPSPQGPRSEPAKSVLKNAMALRRMNSEIDQTRNMNRESSRYVHLGREASPLLPWIGSPDLSESCNDLFDFDFGSPNTGAGAEWDAYGVEGGVGKERSALDDIDMSALDRRLDGALAGFDAGPPSDTSAQSYSDTRSTVWEDGEKFWEGRPDFTFTRSSPLPVNVTPVKKGSIREHGQSGSVTPTQQQWLKMPEAPSSVQKTPKSLYDSEGFLRS